METIVFNPYQEIGKQLTLGLDFIASNLNVNSNVDDLVNVVYQYIQPIYYPSKGKISTQLQVEIKSVAYTIINSYNNQLLCGYNSRQMTIIEMFLGPTTTCFTPINALNTWFTDIENNIAKSDLSIEDQIPLLLGSEIAKTILSYWLTKVTAPGKWSQFFEQQIAINYANIPLWVVAAIEGGFIGANTSNKGLIAPTIDITSTNIISSLIGALTIGAGKVIFKWVPKIQPEQLITESPNGLFLGGFSRAMQSASISSEIRGANNCKDGLCPVVNNCNGGNCKRGCGSTE